MRTDRSGERVACARCRANNFVGQAQCWQCGHSLPPPEAVNAGVNTGVNAGLNAAMPPVPSQARPVPIAPAARPAVAPAAYSPPIMAPVPYPVLAPPYAAGGRKRGTMPLVIGIALLTAAVVLLLAARHTTSAHGAPSLSFGAGRSNSGDPNDLNADARGVVPERDMPQSGTPDPRGARLSMPARDTLPTGGDPNEMAARRAIENAIPRLGLPPQTSPDNSVHLRSGDTISRDQYEDVQRKLQAHPLFGGQPPVPRL